MKIKVSVGNAPKSESLETSVYSLTLTAQSNGERRWLAGLYSCLRKFLDFNPIQLKAEVPVIRITTVTETK